VIETITHAHSPTLCRFEDSQTATVGDEYFGKRSIHNQLLEFSCMTHRFALSHQDRHTLAAILTTSDNLDELSTLRGAFLNALNLRLGLIARSPTTSVSMEGYDSLVLRSLEHTVPAIDMSFPALQVRSYDDGTNQRFLQRAVEFFVREDRVGLEDYMEAFWHSPAASLHVSESILGAVIEGLANDILDRAHPGQAKARSKQFDKLKQAALKVIKENESIENDPLVESLKQALRTASPTAAAQNIKAAGEAVGLSVTQEDSDAWRSMRNAAAHGAHIKKENDAVRGTEFLTCVDLLNRFSLALIGYEGRCFVYGSGWEEAELRLQAQ